MGTHKKLHKIDPEVKQQILNRIKHDGVSVSQAAEDHGVSTGTIYTWLTKGTSENPSWSEVARLKKENTQLLQLVGELTVKMSQTQKKSSPCDEALRDKTISQKKEKTS